MTHDEELVLRPESGRSPQERDRYSRIYPAPAEYDLLDGTVRSQRPQYPIASLLVLTFFAAIGVMACNWSNRGMLAGLLGVPALIATWQLTFAASGSSLLQTTRWGFVLSYVTACLVAWINS